VAQSASAGRFPLAGVGRMENATVRCVAYDYLTIPGYNVNEHLEERAASSVLNRLFVILDAFALRGPMNQLKGVSAAANPISGNTAVKTILIVEDNELNMKLFHDLLEAHGYNILQTKDGMEALKMARQHHPDLILMDIQLPEVSGLEVTKWIKEDDNLRSIPIIAVTAFAMKGDEEKIREGGCEAYIAKPISVANFLQTVQRFLN
jgi:two-component system, cell cycle response regulator DivK